MANNNEPKGSKWNPYSDDEYTEINTSTNQTWYGGWVGSINSSTYIKGDGDFSSQISSSLGSTEHPFSSDQRQTIMNENPGFWPGGWSQSLEGLKYYLTGATFYDATNNYGEPLGAASYPCPMEVYSNMCKNGIWNGGYVTYGGPDDIYFVDRGEIVNGNGSGCGCGAGNGASGSGSGSGTGSGSGSEGPGEVVLVFTPGEAVIGQSADMIVSLSWDQVPRFNISITAISSPNIAFIIEENTVSIVWNGHSTVSATGNLSYAKLHLAVEPIPGETFLYEGFLVTSVEHNSISVTASNISIS